MNKVKFKNVKSLKLLCNAFLQIGHSVLAKTSKIVNIKNI